MLNSKSSNPTQNIILKKNSTIIDIEIFKKYLFNADIRKSNADIRRFYPPDNLRPSALHLRESAFKVLFQSSHIDHLTTIFKKKEIKKWNKQNLA